MPSPVSIRSSQLLFSVVVIVASVALLPSPGAAAVSADDFDDRLVSGTTYWAGQELYFNCSRVVGNVSTASRSERTFQLRRVTTDNEVGGLVREFVVDTDGETVIDTARLDGFYLIHYRGDTVYVLDGRGYTDDPPDETSVTVANSRWETAIQELSASWSDDVIYRDDPVDLELRSNRVTYQVELSAEGLDFDELEEMFSSRDFADDHDAEADDDGIILDASDETDLRVDFGEVDNGLYTFTIEVRDATATATAEARVGRVDEPDPSPTPTTEPTPTASPRPEPTSTASPTPPGTTIEPPPPTVTASPTVAPTMPPPSPSPTASPTSSPTATDTPTASPGQPGFGWTVTAIALLGLVSLARRRIA